ncbi:hypothetical protein HanHA300_Chr01g0023371 [Helianthus annuus]|uniref:Uncharacterized protein n=1 Tax=Helianthus annuus TaxID=4232 RepID=A0A251VQ77_HELAN|nr:hypothetical protein HanHA300_Chr01g0023371 [Helianthus annuus]KAJ0627454.1 hypothetical protein HanHA89_Chr01g0025561 [Helianthus annuus]
MEDSGCRRKHMGSMAVHHHSIDSKYQGFVFAFWIGIVSQFFVLRQQFQTLAKIIGGISVSFVPKIENIQQVRCLIVTNEDQIEVSLQVYHNHVGRKNMMVMTYDGKTRLQ